MYVPQDFADHFGTLHAGIISFGQWSTIFLALICPPTLAICLSHMLEMVTDIILRNLNDKFSSNFPSYPIHFTTPISSLPHY